MRPLLLGFVSLFCLICLVACQNSAPADQLTVVQGTVASADSGRPLRGVLMTVGSFQWGLVGRPYPAPTGDSVRTDAQGEYALSFRNTKGLHYASSLQIYANAAYLGRPRYTFDASRTRCPLLAAGSWEVSVGKTTAVDFKTSELRPVAVRLPNRNTRYQRLDFDCRSLRGNALDTLAYPRSYYLPAAGAKFRYYNLNAANQLVKDTLVALGVQNPASVVPDTVRATLACVR